MFFEERIFRVGDVEFSEKTEYCDGKLKIDKQGLIAHLWAEIENIALIDIHIAKPGDQLRIVNVLDVVEPRVQADGNALFPGFLTQSVAIDPCRANCLRNVSVLTTAAVEAKSPLYTPKEGVVDMSGPAAQLSPFSKLMNVVIEIKLAEGVSDEESDLAIHLLGLKAADYLARATLAQEPSEVLVYQNLAPAENLPKIAVVLQLGSEAALHDNFIYGRGVSGIIPSYIDLAELFVGALVDGNFTYACQRNYTYCYQNNHLLRRLYEEHGKTHSFAGIIISRGYNQSHSDKMMAASYSARLAQKLGAEGVIITAEGAGNAHVDVMFTCQECEKLGIKSVIIIDEIAGDDGTDPSLVDFVPSAKAIVTSGNREELMDVGELPTVGGNALVVEKGQVIMATREYCASTSEIGEWSIGVKEY